MWHAAAWGSDLWSSSRWQFTTARGASEAPVGVMHAWKKDCVTAIVADGLVNMACHEIAAGSHLQEQATRACMVV